MEFDPQNPESNTVGTIINEMRVAAEMLRHPASTHQSPIIGEDLHVGTMDNGIPSEQDWETDRVLAQLLGKVKSHNENLLHPGLPIIMGTIGDVHLVRQVEAFESFEQSWLRYYLFDARAGMVHGTVEAPLEAANETGIHERLALLEVPSLPQERPRKLRGFLRFIR